MADVVWRATLVAILTGCGGFNSYDGVLDSDLDEADTDTDTDTDADADTDTDVDTDTDGDTDTDEVCEGPVSNWDLGPQGPQGGTFAPTHVGVWMDGIVESDAIVDMSFNGAFSSAWIAFEFYASDGTGVTHICSAIFDASTSTSPVNPNSWQTESGGALFHAWNLSLSAQDGFTNCPSMSNFTPSDPRQWVAQRAWGVGYGQMVDLAVDLRDILGDVDWFADWEPYVFSIYMRPGLEAARESGFIRRFEHDCYDIADGTPALTRPTGPFDDQYAGNAGTYVVYSMSTL